MDMSSGGRSYFAYEHLNGGWYGSRLGAGGYTSHPAHYNRVFKTPLMWKYFHAVDRENARASPSLHAGLRRAMDYLSIRATSFTHPRQVHRHFSLPPFLSMPD